MSESIDRASTTFAELPERLAVQRDATFEALSVRQEALDDTLRGLQETSREGERLASAITDTLGASERMLTQLADTSGALRETVDSVDRLMGRFESPAAAAAGGETPPFDIESYTSAIVALTEAARELNTLIGSSMTLLESDAITRHLDDATRRGDSFADLIFRRTLTLIAVFFVMLLAYRVIVLLLQRRFPPRSVESRQ